MARKDEILHSNGDFWVCEGRPGIYEVYRVENSHSVRCASFGPGDGRWLSRAIKDCNRRAALMHPKDEVTK